MKTQVQKPLCHPRDYAAAILAEHVRERRAQLLEACPEHWRDLVREYVERGFASLQAYRKHREGRQQLAKQKPPAAPRREGFTSVINHKSSAPEVGNQRLAELRALIGKGAP